MCSCLEITLLVEAWQDWASRAAAPGVGAGEATNASINSWRGWSASLASIVRSRISKNYERMLAMRELNVAFGALSHSSYFAALVSHSKLPFPRVRE